MSGRSLSAILVYHLKRYPLLEARDVYKLIHQGVFGPGHIITSAAEARKALASEVRRQKSECRSQNGRAEELIEPIDPDGRLVRVNLRPLAAAAEVRSQKAECRRQNGGTEWLVEAMVESARRVEGDEALMKRRLSAAVRWCRTSLPGEATRLEQLAARFEESGFPALHHSPEYRRAYRPAYRVVLSDCLRRRASGRAG